MPREPRLPTLEDQVDELPPSPAADPLLSLAGRTPGRAGFGSQLLLALLAVLLLLGFMVLLLLAVRAGQRHSPALRQAIGAASLPPPSGGWKH